MSDTKISDAAVEAASASMEATKNSLEMTPLDRIRLMLTAALPHLHPQPAELAEQQGVELPPPDEKLLHFYDVSTYPQLVEALEEHVMKLLDLRKRNVKPWEDTFPPTLLPKYERDQHPVFAKDLLALADKWQDAAAETWGEGPVNSTKQDCCDELRGVVSASIYARTDLATNIGGAK